MSDNKELMQQQPQQQTVHIVQLQAHMDALAVQRNNALNEAAELRGRLALMELGMKELQAELEKLKTPQEEAPSKVTPINK